MRQPTLSGILNRTFAGRCAMVAGLCVVVGGGSFSVHAQAQTAAPTVEPTPARPNIVFIMADDVGPGDIGFNHVQRTGTPPLAPSPTLDALAQSGLRFTDAHSPTALCSPTRYCVMTGNLNHRSYAPWGVWGSFRESPVTDADVTLGRLAREAGMATGFVGKWHLGGDFMNADGTALYRGNDRGDEPLPVDVSRIVAGGPQSLGFDYSYTLPCGIQGPLYVAYENGDWHPFGEASELIHYTSETAMDPAFVSDKGPGMGDSLWDARRVGMIMAEKAEAFILEQAENDEPFFLCYWSPMVHLPHVPAESFNGRPIRGQTPTHHLDMILDLDAQVAQIIAALVEAGVADNTIIVFSSDNGGLQDGPGQRAGHDSSGGWRGFKNQAYEGGHRVPMFVVWPGVVEANQVSDEPVGVHDLVATMADLFEHPLEHHQAMDSMSLLPLIRGEEGFTGRSDFLLQGGSFNQLIYRQGDWKLIIQSDHPVSFYEPIALFNLAENPREEESGNLIDDPEQIERAQAMFARYLSIRESGARSVPLPE